MVRHVLTKNVLNRGRQTCFRRHCCFTQAFLSVTKKEITGLQAFNRSNRMVSAQSAERLMRTFLGERKGIGLKFAANVHFWI